MNASRIFITIVAMLVLLAALAAEVDRQSHEPGHPAGSGLSAATEVP